MRHHITCRIALLLSLAVSSGGAAWADPGPLATRPLYSFNQSPLVQIFGLPALGDSVVLEPEQSDLAVRLQIANNFAGISNPSESVYLDGETHRLTFAWKQGLAGGMEWGIEVPYVTHGGGFLDKTIETWHDNLGLPQGGRTETPRNLIEYRYTRDGVNLVNLTRSVGGLGDVRLQVAKQVELDEDESGFQGMALRASLKLPTGKSGELLGSGSTDLALWISAEAKLVPEAWNIYGGGGILLMTEGKVMPEFQRRQVSFGTMGVSRRFGRVTVLGQLDAHSPFYKATDLRPLGRYAVQGLLGVAWEISPRRFLEFSASEDLIANTSPDVVFTLSLSTPL